ncbi:MAG: NAD(P)H-dependent oxidoreductase subunit E [Alphaproteobacteria bacterium]|nr:NAD(P)H-dependent oxidoreductase subunit E [Alphaproteobacteria bacterium]
MAKVKIQICNGTTCFVMGGGNQQALSEILKNKYQDKIEIEAVRCFELCSQKDAFSKAPFVKVDGQMIDQANLEKIKKVIEEKL